MKTRLDALKPRWFCNPDEVDAPVVAALARAVPLSDAGHRDSPVPAFFWVFYPFSCSSFAPLAPLARLPGVGVRLLRETGDLDRGGWRRFSIGDAAAVGFPRPSAFRGATAIL